MTIMFMWFKVIWDMIWGILLPAMVGNLSYANYGENERLNCLCFMNRACIKDMTMKLNV